VNLTTITLPAGWPHAPLVVIGMAFAATAAVPTGQATTPFTAVWGPAAQWRSAEGIGRAAFAAARRGARRISPVQLAGV
jgi:hypothetical protein